MCLRRDLTKKESLLYRFLGIKPKPEIAKEDIICYKVLHHYSIYDKKYFSPAQSTPYILEEGEDNVFSVDNNENKCSVFKYKDDGKNVNYAIEITDGYIHSYTQNDFREIMSHIDTHTGWYDKDECIFKCIIPKGTKYYKGEVTRMSYETYASKKIIVKEKIVTVEPLTLYCPH